MRPAVKPIWWAKAGVVLLLGALIFGLSGLALAQPASGKAVMILEVRGVIDPVIAQYVIHGLDTANHSDAQLVIIRLDTPGGLDTAMREMVQAILNSEVPVAVYVEPSGARAASAGVFVTMAAHLAAMAPGTNIGAAHPVTLGDQSELTAALEDKLTNDAVAYLQAIAQQRGRNADWAETAVRQSASLTAQQVVERQVVDLIADDVADLLTQLDGRQVTTRNGARTLELTAVPLEEHPMTWLEMIAHGLVDPNIAYILLSLGTIALIAEFYYPGTILPGVTGAISFVLGSLFLFSPFAPSSPTMPRLTVSPWLLVLMTLLFVGFFSFALTAGLRAQRQKVLINRQGPIGATGIALSELAPEGVVQVRSEIWTAVATDLVRAGETVEVIGGDGLYLQVRRSG